jgi:hypothetical protein
MIKKRAGNGANSKNGSSNNFVEKRKREKPDLSRKKRVAAPFLLFDDFFNNIFCKNGYRIFFSCFFFWQ